MPCCLSVDCLPPVSVTERRVHGPVSCLSQATGMGSSFFGHHRGTDRSKCDHLQQRTPFSALVLQPLGSVHICLAQKARAGLADQRLGASGRHIAIRCPLCRCLPFRRAEVKHAAIDADHHVAILDIDLQLHRAICLLRQPGRVFLCQVDHLEIVEARGAALDFIPPDLGLPAAIGVDGDLFGLAAGLANDLLAGQAQCDP